MKWTRPRWASRPEITASGVDRQIERIGEEERLLLEKTRMIRVRRHYRQHTNSSAFLDWLAVFIGVTCFVFIVLWAASPDSRPPTWQLAIGRAVSYGLPITLGMWGVSRATRKDSFVPKGMAEKLPYARFNADGKVESTTIAEERDGIVPHPLGGQGKGSDDGT